MLICLCIRVKWLVKIELLWGNGMKKLIVSLFAIVLIFSLVTVLYFGVTKKAPEPISEKKDTRIVFLADSRGPDGGVNERVLSDLLLKIKKLDVQPEYIVFGGDLVTGSLKVKEYKAQLEKFKRVFKEYFPLEKLLPVFGNHEEYSSTNDLTHEKLFGEAFSKFQPTNELDGFNRTVYYKDVNDARLVILNSYHVGEDSQIIDKQFEWFKTASANVGGAPKVKIAFLHSPPYPTGGHVGSALDTYPEARDKFWQVIDNDNYMGLFCGHEHIYSRRIVDPSFSPLFKRSVNQVIAGAAGALSPNPAYTSKKGIVVPPTAVFHYAIIDVGATATNVEVVSIDDKVIDKFSVANG